jgi:hypothetical protein
MLMDIARTRWSSHYSSKPADSTLNSI